MSSPHRSQLDRHLAALLDELVELREAVETAGIDEREATLAEVHRALAPTLELIARHAAGGADLSVDALSDSVLAALPALGLERLHDAGEVLELFPEEAREDFVLDREVPTSATLVRVEVLVPGWRRGFVKVVRPRGRVLEVADAQ